MVRGFGELTEPLLASNPDFQKSTLEASTLNRNLATVLQPVEQTAAILLRKTKLTETSLIVRWLTETVGKIQTVAKGARRPQSRFAGALDLFHQCEIQFSRSRKSELHSLREAVLVEPFEQIRYDYVRLELAAYFGEIIELTTEPEQPAPEIYHLLRRALGHLGGHPASKRALLHFESELAQLLGIGSEQVTPAVAIGRVCHRLPRARRGLIERLE